MKPALICVLMSLVGFISARSIYYDIPVYNTAYGYLTRFGIPKANRIQRAEEELLKGQASRIVGGSPSAAGQFNYQAGLISDIIGTENKSACGGSLITTNRVLTAAHCWYDGENQAWRFTVVLGSILLFSGGTRIETTDVTMHSKWTPQLIRNDIAIIRLPTSVILSSTIGTVALPTGTQLLENFSGSEATASGFGLTRDGGSMSNDQFLSHVHMEVITNLRCSKVFPLFIHSSHICTATTGGVSTCRGDSGGPLTVERNGESILIGITSFGSALGCEIGMPAVFVRVSSFMDFIKENL